MISGFMVRIPSSPIRREPHSSPTGDPHTVGPRNPPRASPGAGGAPRAALPCARRPPASSLGAFRVRELVAQAGYPLPIPGGQSGGDLFLDVGPPPVLPATAAVDGGLAPFERE